MPKSQTQTLKKELLKTARELLISEGYRNFSLREVARSTGVSATSIYIYFDNKDHLIHRLMEQSIDELNDKLKEVADQHVDPFLRLRGFADAYVNYALENPREYQIIYLVSSDEMSRYPKEKFRKARNGYVLLTRAIREAIAEGILDEPHPRTAAYIFWAQLHGVMDIVLSKRLDSRIDQSGFIEQAINHILQGL